MGAFSDYMENALAAWIAGTNMPAAPATVSVGLFTANPADTGTGGAPANGTEATGTGYARQPITTATGWSAVAVTGTDQHVSNAAAISFGTVGAGAWGTITGVGIWDAPSGGNLLFWFAISPTQVTAQGSTVSINAGSLVIAFD